MAPRDFQGLSLQRVVIAPEQPHGERVRLLSVEQYDDGVILRSVLSGGPPMPQSAEEMRASLERIDAFGVPLLDLTDDLGTRYALVSGGGASYGGVWHQAFVYTPAVPADAQRLDVMCSDWSLSLDLA